MLPLSFTRLTKCVLDVARIVDAPRVGALLLCLSALLISQQCAASGKIYSCENAAGQRVFQDSPCRLGLSQFSNEQTDPSKWSRAQRERASCSVHSPLLGLRWVRESATIEFEGGAYLLLRASESGIAATMVLDAVWPAEEQAPQPAPVFSDASPTSKLGDVSAEKTPVLSARRLELSGDISGHAVLPAGHVGFMVDSMDDPTRMRFGFFQSSSLIRALRKAPSMAFRLTLRRPEISLTTDAIPLDGLGEAIRSLERCQRGDQK